MLELLQQKAEAPTVPLVVVVELDPAAAGATIISNVPNEKITVLILVCITPSPKPGIDRRQRTISVRSSSRLTGTTLLCCRLSESAAFAVRQHRFLGSQGRSPRTGIDQRGRSAKKSAVTLEVIGAAIISSSCDRDWRALLADVVDIVIRIAAEGYWRSSSAP